MSTVTRFLSLAISAGIFIFSSCSQQNHSVGNAYIKQDLLTSGTWKLVKYSIGGEDVTNQLFQYFEKDDFVRFNEDGTVVYTDAGYKSNPSGDKITKWNMSDDQSVLAEEGIGDFNIEVLTANTIKLSTTLAGMKNEITMSH